ncbi:MAG: hypothetical protein Q9226_001744 [Calogaya cf. arnoldii]
MALQYQLASPFRRCLRCSTGGDPLYVLSSRAFSTSPITRIEASTDHLSSKPDIAPPGRLLDPNRVATPRLERRLFRETQQQPIGSRRRRAALQSTANIPFEQLPYQCFQEARNLLLADRRNKLIQIDEERRRIAKVQATPAELCGGGYVKKGRLVRMQKYLEELKILADINDPVIKKRFEDGQGDMNRPIYRYLANRQWRQQRRLILMQRMNQMHIVPDVVSYLDPTAEVKLSFGRRNVQPGDFVESQNSEMLPRLSIQVFDRGERLVSIAVVDPDVPNLDADSFDSRCHFLAVNVPISPTSTSVPLAQLYDGSQTVRPWLPPHAQKGSPYHRLVVFIVEQNDGPTLNWQGLKRMAENQAAQFNIRSFMDKVHGKLTGVHLFRTKWDDGMADVMQRAGIAGADIELKRMKPEKLPYKKKNPERYSSNLTYRNGYVIDLLPRFCLQGDATIFQRGPTVFQVFAQLSKSQFATVFPSLELSLCVAIRRREDVKEVLSTQILDGRHTTVLILLRMSQFYDILADALQNCAGYTQERFDRELRRQLSKDASIHFPSSPQIGNLTDRWSDFLQGDTAFVVEPATTAYVAASAKFATRRDLPFLAVGGGHRSTSALNTIRRGLSINFDKLKKTQLTSDGISALCGRA